MDRKVGLWIDHKRTVIVSLVGKEEDIRLIHSDVERHVGPSGGSRSKMPYGPQDVSAEDKRERHFEGHLRKYYDEVISCVRDAESILIFGPGAAKNELQKRMASMGLGERIVAVETSDKMTDRQIAARVRQHFLD